MTPFWRSTVSTGMTLLWYDAAFAAKIRTLRPGARWGTGITWKAELANLVKPSAFTTAATSLVQPPIGEITECMRRVNIDINKESLREECEA
ncbi:hypothetical protein N657DRAFT_677717 [Parathielavia appendiculata]|uniref:Uncharacterized protein n=1 Tax=Parathielavia appendiculata TaxID=2587402 RepID=A0AAN6U689_9PEZI|nr:hypothetical protein N657DRAFT_677717 [Parathielavia appendiculata]